MVASMNWFPVGSFAGIVKVAVNVPSLATIGLTRGVSPKDCPKILLEDSAELMEILTIVPGVHPLPLTVTTVPDDPDMGLTVKCEGVRVYLDGLAKMAIGAKTPMSTIVGAITTRDRRERNRFMLVSPH